MVSEVMEKFHTEILRRLSRRIGDVMSIDSPGGNHRGMLVAVIAGEGVELENLGTRRSIPVGSILDWQTLKQGEYQDSVVLERLHSHFGEHVRYRTAELRFVPGDWVLHRIYLAQGGELTVGMRNGTVERHVTARRIRGMR